MLSHMNIGDPERYVATRKLCELLNWMSRMRLFACFGSMLKSDATGPTETREGWGREAPFLVQNRRAGTWLAGLRRSDAVSKCQNCPPIIFGTCNYADFRGNFSSRGNFITGQCIGTLLFQRRSSHYHSIDDYTVKQRLRTSVSIRGHAAGVTDRGEDVRAPFGYRSEGER